MSSFDTAREKWELYHMKERDKVKEAAAKGDPEAMENLAYHINKIEYNCRDQVIELLTAASDAGRETASWKLADLYANWDEKKYHDKIEHYCRLAFASGNTYSDKEPESIYGSIHYWIEKHHPEWCEMEEGFYDDGKYYLHPTYCYGMNVFRGIGEKAARQMRHEEKEAEALWREADKLFEKDNQAGYQVWLELCQAGNAHAAHSLGYCYRTGTVVEKDYQKAIEYYELAIKRGYPSYASLSLIYDKLDDMDRALEILMLGVKANDAGSYAALSEKTMLGRIYGGNSYVAAYLATRAYELDKAEGYQLGTFYLTGIFLPVVYPYAKYCIENSVMDKVALEECGYEFPDFWDKIEAIKPRYHEFSLTLDQCENAIDLEQTLQEGIKLMSGDNSDKEKGRKMILRAAECGSCLAMVSTFTYKIDEWEYFLRRGAIVCGDLDCIETLAIITEEKTGSYYKGNSYLEEVVKLWELREKLHGHIEMDDDVKECYKIFREKYDAMLKAKK